MAQLKVCIDAGHGMSNATGGVEDSGAAAVGVRECDVVLGYALALGDALARSGIAVFHTRKERNEPAPLKYRVKRAQDAGCHAYVSLHLNASDSAESNGLETLYGRPKDAALAAALQSALVRVTGFRDRGIKDPEKAKRTLAVMAFGPGPVVLVELGFVTNATERAAVVRPDFRSRVVAVMADTIAKVLRGDRAGEPSAARIPAPEPTAPPVYNRQPPPGTADRLGAIVPAMQDGRTRLAPKLAGLAWMCWLPNALYFESDLDLDTDGEPEPGVKYEPTHQRGLSIGGGVNSNRVPYIVLPIGFAKDHGVRLGDVAAVLYRDRLEFAVYADNGPRQKFGEGSIALHRALGFERIGKDKRIIDVGIPSGVVTILFPGSGDGTAQTPDRIRAIGRERFAALGGKVAP